MRLAVKPHQPFFLAARTVHTAGSLPYSHARPSSLQSILSPPLFPHRARKERRRRKNASWPRAHAALAVSKQPRSAGVRLGPGARPEQPSIRGKPRGSPHLVPYTLRASGTPPARAHPSNERCLPRSPGGRTTALTDLAWSDPRGLCVTPGGSVRRYQLGVTPRRRVDEQAPILLPGSFGPLTVL